MIISLSSYFMLVYLYVYILYKVFDAVFLQQLFYDFENNLSYVQGYSSCDVCTIILLYEFKIFFEFLFTIFSSVKTYEQYKMYWYFVCFIPGGVCNEFNALLKYLTENFASNCKVNIVFCA